MWNRFEIAKTWDGHQIQPAERVKIAYQVTASGDVDVEFDSPFYGDPAPDASPGPVWGLWDFEVVELFLVGADGTYSELEFGPHGHHLVLTLAGPREIVRRELPMEYRVERAGDRWRGHARIAAAWMPSSIVRFNAFAIHGQGPARRYLAHGALPGPKPDFHQPDRFPRV